MVARLGRNRESHVFAVFLMAAALSGPAQPKHTLAGWFGGPQAETCAAWLANPSAEGVWIAGYWSGINLALKRQVGNQSLETDVLPPKILRPLGLIDLKLLPPIVALL